MNTGGLGHRHDRAPPIRAPTTAAGDTGDMRRRRSTSLRRQVTRFIAAPKAPDIATAHARRPEVRYWIGSEGLVLDLRRVDGEAGRGSGELEVRPADHRLDDPLHRPRRTDRWPVAWLDDVAVLVLDHRRGCRQSRTAATASSKEPKRPGTLITLGQHRLDQRALAGDADR